MVITMIFAVLILLIFTAVRVRNEWNPQQPRSLRDMMKEQPKPVQAILIALVPFVMAVLVNAAWNGLAVAGAPLDPLPYWSWGNAGLLLAVACLRTIIRGVPRDTIGMGPPAAEADKEDSA